MGNECSACTPCTGEPEFNDKVDRNASVVSSVVGLNRKSHENIKFVSNLILNLEKSLEEQGWNRCNR